MDVLGLDGANHAGFLNSDLSQPCRSHGGVRYQVGLLSPNPGFAKIHEESITAVEHGQGLVSDVAGDSSQSRLETRVWCWCAGMYSESMSSQGFGAKHLLVLDTRLHVTNGLAWYSLARKIHELTA